MLRMLPIGEQDFAGLVEMNAVYADKTKIISDLLHTSKYVFLSRPRRFGKSLLISTLKNLFEGKKELFKGLWIENNFDWKEVPVIKIDFNSRSFTDKPLVTTIDKFLDDNAERYEIQLYEQGNRDRFFELITKLHKKTNERVVLLIDEYDKPIVDSINDIQKAEENREILRNFYGAIKGCSEMLRFVLITGISRFSKMSIFSELNNLADISMDENFAAICGFTKDDLNNYFSEYKDAACQKLELSKDELDEKIRFWYDGYKFDGITNIYNPFSILNFFSKKEFRNYWFESGLPKLLADFIMQNGINVKELDNVAMSAEELNNFDVKKINLKALMFQTGYLTIVEKDEYNQYVLDYPNEEVRSSFVKFLLKNYTDEDSSNKRVDMLRALDKGDVDGFITAVNALFASIPYQIIPKENENYFSSLMHVLLKTLGYMVLSELSTYKGRADAVIKTKNFIYIFEYKMASVKAAEGINQIKTKGYADEFMSDPRKKIAVSIVIDRELRCVSEYLSSPVL